MNDSKQQQRLLMYQARRMQVDKEALSAQICTECQSLAEYRQAKTVMWYLHCRSEVRTIAAVCQELEKGCRRIVIPYCTQDEQGQNALGLWLLEDYNELVSGAWDILEPPRFRWGESNKHVGIHELDLIVVPGVGFDRNGGRLGNGAGFYDHLLAQVHQNTLLIGICFEAQLLEKIEMEEHDVYMDRVITEQSVYEGRGR